MSKPKLPNNIEDLPYVEVLGMKFVIPPEGFPEGLSIELLIEGLMEAGVLELVDGKLVAASNQEQDKLMGIDFGVDDDGDVDFARQLTDEEISDAFKGQKN